MNKMNGIFLEGSVTGLYYKTDSIKGYLDETGHFEYLEGETITFFAGSMPLGSARAKQVITPLDFAAEANGRFVTVTHYQVANMTRFLLTLGHITEQKRIITDKYRYGLSFGLEPEDFENHTATRACLEELGLELISLEKAHNLVRRCNKGIYKETDIKIPTRDGRFLLADVYRPLKPGRFPVIMCMGVFGKSFVNGLTLSEEDEAFFEIAEDKFYESHGSLETKRMLQGVFFKRMGPCFGSAKPIPNIAPGKEAPHPDGPPPCLVPVSEVFEQPAAMDWVPYDYVVINIEEYGVGKNPGPFKQFGAGNALDYCDAIEWAAGQEWSTGKVGLFGASYYAMTQYLAAQHHPKGLTAMIPIMGDYDSYRDYVYSGGGLFNRADNMDPCISPQEYNFLSKAMEQPFLNEETYGPFGEYMSSADISKIDYPIWPAVEPDASLHGRGSSEAYIHSPSRNKKLLIVNGCGIHFWMYEKEYMSRYRAFFDYWLKDIRNNIMNEPPVELQIRTGNGNYYWRKEKDWPVPGTNYLKFYLDGNNNGLSIEAPQEEGRATYNADVQRSEIDRVEGVTFISEPVTEDLELAGYIKACLFVSSTTGDMEIHMQVRVLDENNQEVIYPAITSMERGLPLGFGSMKASHRTLDETLSRDYLPVYRHTREAYRPLTPGEIVKCEIGTFPTTGLVKKGWKIRLDIDPVSNRWVCYEEEAYRKGSENTVYTGTSHPSYVQVPVLPRRNLA